MKKTVIIDNRMRKEEKDKLTELGYKLVEVKTNNNVYSEISSHVDIFACKIGNKVIVEPNLYENLQNIPQLKKGQETIQNKYPFDIKYNICIIGNKAIHNFQYTDSKTKQILIDDGYNLINTTQGYTNCSIAVIDDNSAIVSDKGLYKILQFHGIETLLVKNDLDIKLLNENQYSNKKGFIGGCMSRIGNSIMVFGDLNKIDIDGKIKTFIKSKGLDIIEFKGLDIIDYGGLIEI